MPIYNIYTSETLTYHIVIDAPSEEAVYDYLDTEHYWDFKESSNPTDGYSHGEDIEEWSEKDLVIAKNNYQVSELVDVAVGPDGSVLPGLEHA